jgi:hypothetical protein
MASSKEMASQNKGNCLIKAAGFARMVNRSLFAGHCRTDPLITIALSCGNADRSRKSLSCGDAYFVRF